MYKRYINSIIIIIKGASVSRWSHNSRYSPGLITEPITPIWHLHISHNAPYLPPPPPKKKKKKMQNLCFSFLLYITTVLREIENNAYAKLGGGGQIRCLMGDVQVANGLGCMLCIVEWILYFACHALPSYWLFVLCRVDPCGFYSGRLAGIWWQFHSQF